MIVEEASSGSQIGVEGKLHVKDECVTFGIAQARCLTVA